jgi:K+-H+ exchange-related protein
MEVFLIPVGRDRYELYCEVPDEDPSGATPANDRGFFRGLVRKFRDTLNRIEHVRRRHEEEDAGQEHGWFERLKRRGLRLVAESIAEQRLLWHLRRQHKAVAVHPEDLPGAAAMGIVRPALQADFEKHRRWLAIDGVLVVLSALLILVPGPNVLGYYFAFRVVGHYFSMRGARQGLDHVVWTTRPNDALADLRPLVLVHPDQRRSSVEAIAERLELSDLRRFFDRVALPDA